MFSSFFRVLNNNRKRVASRSHWRRFCKEQKPNLSESVQKPATSIKVKKNPIRSALLPIGILSGAAIFVSFLYPGKPSKPTFKDDLIKLEKIFTRFASIEEEGEKFMTVHDFVRAIAMKQLPEGTADLFVEKMSMDSEDFEQLFVKQGKIPFSAFVFFDTLLSTSKEEFITAFNIFDTDGDGYMSRDEFQRLMKASGHVKFRFDNEYWDSLFGQEPEDRISVDQFLHLVKSVKVGLLKQEFREFDDGTGHINGKAFSDLLLLNTRRSALPKYVADNFATVEQAYEDTSVSLDEYLEFSELLEKLPVFSKAVSMAQLGQRHGISRADLRRIARISCGVDLSQDQLDIIFHIFDSPKKHGALHVSPFIEVLQNRRKRRLFNVHQLEAVQQRFSQTPVQRFVTAVKSFGLGAIAGAIGAAAVYPIDLVKTRMQNQRNALLKSAEEGASSRLYKSSMDCFWTTLRTEGPLGLYRGLLPQLIGVAPEKAIKLLTNDILRDLFSSESGELDLPLEIIAGGGAGASQVVFTNPIEIIKIRLQVQGELARVYGVKPKGTIQIIQELGLTGIYKGASACFMRDIPFSAIYFPTYAALKEYLRDDRGRVTPWDLLFAGSFAGLVAASTTTPMDVIKTRLQVEARKGDQTYSGIGDCFVKILRSEGPMAFFKGVVPRTFRSSPQFGITLLSYEVLQKFFDPEKEIYSTPPTNAPVDQKDLEGEEKKEMLHKWGVSVTDEDKRESQ